MLTRQGDWKRAYPGCQAPNSRQTRRELDDARSCSDTASPDLGAAAEKSTRFQAATHTLCGTWGLVSSRSFPFSDLGKKACLRLPKRDKEGKSQQELWAGQALYCR